jgi:hypothetical protein
VNLNHSALQLPYIAHALQIAGKDHDGKRAQTKIIAEIQKVNSPRAFLDAHDRAGNALDLAHMFSCLGKGKTIRPREAAQERGHDEQRVMVDRRQGSFRARLPREKSARENCKAEKYRAGGGRQKKSADFPK